MSKYSLFLAALAVLTLTACEAEHEVLDLKGAKMVLLKDVSLDREIQKSAGGVFYTNSLDCVTKRGELKNSREEYKDCRTRMHCEFFFVNDDVSITVPAGFTQASTTGSRAWGRDGWGETFSYFRIDFDRRNDSVVNPRLNSIRCSTKGNFDDHKIEFEEVQEILNGVVRFE